MSPSYAVQGGHLHVKFEYLLRLALMVEFGVIGLINQLVTRSKYIGSKSCEGLGTPTVRIFSSEQCNPYPRTPQVEELRQEE